MAANDCAKFRKTSLTAAGFKIFLILSLSTGASSVSFAQFDDGDFPLPPPPPPPANQQQMINSQQNRATPPPAGNFGGPASGSAAAGAKIGAPAQTADKKAKLASAGIEDITNENFGDTIESFDFPNADITDIAHAISELTGKNFIIDPAVRGKISVIAPSKITVAEAYKAFLSALAINGFAIVPSGKFLKIRSARNAQRDGIETYSGAYYPNADQMITRIIHLKHIQAETVQNNLRILTSKDGELSPYAPTNSLIISDYGSNIDRVMRIINQLDVAGFEDQMEVIPIRFAKSKDIAELINKIVNKGDSKSAQPGGFGAGVPRFSRPAGGAGPQGSTSAYFLVFPDDRTNSLIVVGNKTGIERVRKLVSQLDFRLRPDESGGVHVYYLKFGDAEKIAATLSGIAKDTTPKATTGTGGTPAISPTAGLQTPQEIFGGDVKITADKGTNSLVIVASKQDYETVLDLLLKLDIPNDQVYVEAIIMEMNSSDQLNWQIGFFQYDQSGTGLHSGFSGMDPSTLSSLVNPFGGQGAILGFGSGGNIQITSPTTGSSTTGGSATTGSTITLPTLASFVNFIKKNAHGNILSTPGVLALNNQEATISVGDQVVTSLTTTTAANGTSTTNPVLSDATIDLKIKPFISPSSNKIRLDIDAQIKQLSTIIPPAAFQSNTVPLAKRAIKTSIVLPNGDTAVLGGLMKDVDTEQVIKVPLLGDIPIIGWLFKSRNVTKEKQNLVVFLTPRILRGPEDTSKLLKRSVDKRLGFIKDQGGRDPYGATIDEVMGVTAVKDARDNEEKKTQQKE